MLLLNHTSKISIFVENYEETKMASIDKPLDKQLLNCFEVLRYKENNLARFNFLNNG